MLLRIGLISMVGSTLGQKTRNGSIRLARAANALPWPSTARAVTAKFLKSRRVYPTRSPLAARWLTGGARSELQAQACDQGVVARVFGVMARIGQAQVETAAELMIQTQIKTQAAALELTTVHLLEYALAVDRLVAQAVAAQVLPQRQTGTPYPLALLPVPGRGQAPAKRQVASLLVRCHQALSVETPGVGIQMH